MRHDEETLRRQPRLGHGGRETPDVELDAQLFHAVFRSARDAMLIADDEGRYVEANPAACQLLGRSRDEVLEMSLFDVSPAEVDATAAWNAFLERGEMSGEYVIRRADGTTVDVEFRAAADVLPGLHLSIMRDITDRKELERERAVVERRLRRAQRVESLGVLATGVAHDFNTIMAEIRGNADLLQPEVDPRHREQVEAIHAALDRAMAVTERLLSFGRQTELDARRMHVNAIVGRVRPIVEPMLAAGVELVVDLTDDDRALVNVDPQIDQVLLNLIRNARDAMPEGGRLTITTDVRRATDGSVPAELGPGRYAELRVGDTGTGMDPETVERALDPFFTTKRSWSPSGLGLSTAYGFVTQHGGSLTLDSTPGVGTAVSLWLPVVDPDGRGH